MTSAQAAALVGLSLLITACAPREAPAPAMVLLSPAFRDRAPIPALHTCEGADRRPPLRWENLPPGAATLAVTVVDPDAPDPAAPEGTWTHWVAWDLPASAEAIPIGPDNLLEGAREGLNDFKERGWRGPCPPRGRHRYEFKLFALDQALGDLGEADLPTLMGAMQGHVLATATLTGTYEKATGGRGYNRR